MKKKILFSSLLFAGVIGALNALTSFKKIPVAVSTGIGIGIIVVFVIYIQHLLKNRR